MTDLRYLIIEKRKNRISAVEWKSLILTDPELEFQNFVIGRNPRTYEEIRIETICGKYRSKQNNCHFTFVYDEGKIICSSCDEESWTKGKEIAQKLKSKISIETD